MIRHRLTAGLAASALALALTPAWAGQRSSNGDTVGSAVPRESGGGGASAAPAPSSGGFGGGADAGTWISAPVREAPSRAPQRAEQRDRGDNPSSGQAVPRDSGGGGGSTSSSAGSSSAGSGSRGGGRSADDVPTYSRPRDGRDAQGRAVARRGGVPARPGGGGAYYPGVIYDPYGSYFYDPYYSRYSSYWAPYGYGYGLGYFAYDPFLFGGGGGYGGGYGYDPYQGGGARGYRGVGSMRLKVKPADAQVYVDGYYVGTVDSFDGAFQRLTIEEGAHRVEVRAEGHESVQFEVMILPGETVTYKGDLKRGR